MTFTPTQVRENWGPEGLDVVNDLMRVHGTELLPDPVRDETLKDYVHRCARSGLCHVVGDLHMLQDALAYRAADEKGIPCYELDALEPEFRGEHLRDVPVNERFEQYKKETQPVAGATDPAASKFSDYMEAKNTLTGHI